MKIGILGGTFNPVHLGHLILAQEMQSQLKLDKVIFIPTNIAAHKEEIKVSAKDRLAMLKLAVSDNPFFEVSDLEIKRGGVSYTIDTVETLKKDYPEDKLFLIIGSDLAKDFSTWKQPEILKKEITIVVAQRKEYFFDQNKWFLALPVTQVAISSSLIRELIKKNISIKYLVPEAVLQYIKENNLYL